MRFESLQGGEPTKPSMDLLFNFSSYYPESIHSSERLRSVINPFDREKK